MLCFKGIIPVIALIFLSQLNPTFATFSSNSQTILTTCQSTGCLNGIQVSTTITDYPDECKQVYTYRFKCSLCTISNFVVDRNDFTTSCQHSGCYSAISNSYGPCGTNYQSNITNPMKFDINQNTLCRAGEYETKFTVYNKKQGLVPMALKGGQDCTLCSLPGPVNDETCTGCQSDSQCDDGIDCTTDTCDNCGRCKHTPVNNCLVTSTGLQARVTTGVTASITTGVHGAVTSGEAQPVTTGESLPVTTGVAAAVTTGTTGFNGGGLGLTGSSTSTGTGTTGGQACAPTGSQCCVCNCHCPTGTTIRTTGTTGTTGVFHDYPDFLVEEEPHKSSKLEDPNHEKNIGINYRSMAIGFGVAFAVMVLITIGVIVAAVIVLKKLGASK